jgi:hypothetical protein
MARLNARQKRAAKRRLAIHDLAVHRNPSNVATDGLIRSSTGFAKVLVAAQVIPSVAKANAPRDTNLEGLGKLARKPAKRWGITK